MAEQTLSTLYHCVFNLNYHLVLVTKRRRKCMTAAMLERLEAICRHVGVEQAIVSPAAI